MFREIEKKSQKDAQRSRFALQLPDRRPEAQSPFMVPFSAFTKPSNRAVPIRPVAKPKRTSGPLTVPSTLPRSSGHRVDRPLEWAHPEPTTRVPRWTKRMRPRHTQPRRARSITTDQEPSTKAGSSWAPAGRVPGRRSAWPKTRIRSAPPTVNLPRPEAGHLSGVMCKSLPFICVN